ncbi:MAG: hypothetical protein PHV70_11205 [Desulfobacteraceae bacterium]|nr:hypothetical protein [Desulfobacteraceae bacterium]
MMVASKQDTLTVELVVTEADLWRFFGLLRQGILVTTHLPSSLQQLLLVALKIPDAYVRERIQTVFLNGKAVDDIQGASVSDGDVVTLSAAMPGLVGATLRKGGQLTNLRSSLSHRSLSTETEAVAPGMVTVKLFNLVCAELGPPFLGRGVLLPGGHFKAFLADVWPELAPACIGARIGEKPVEAAVLPESVAPGAMVRLKVGTQTR